MKNEEFLQQLNIVIKMLEDRLVNEPNKPILRTIYNNYNKSIEVINNGDDIKKIRIKGSMRAYLESYSDYKNPILQEMGKAERMLDALLRNNQYE